MERVSSQKDKTGSKFDITPQIFENAMIVEKHDDYERINKLKSSQGSNVEMLASHKTRICEKVFFAQISPALLELFHEEKFHCILRVEAESSQKPGTALSAVVFTEIARKPNPEQKLLFLLV